MELSLGQVVEWKASPSGYAQIHEFRRTRVRIAYRDGHRVHYVLLPARKLRIPATLFPIHNPFNLAYRPKTKVFTVQ